MSTPFTTQLQMFNQRNGNVANLSGPAVGIPTVTDFGTTGLPSLEGLANAGAQTDTDSSGYSTGPINQQVKARQGFGEGFVKGDLVFAIDDPNGTQDGTSMVVTLPQLNYYLLEKNLQQIVKTSKMFPHDEYQGDAFTVGKRNNTSDDYFMDLIPTSIFQFKKRIKFLGYYTNRISSSVTAEDYQDEKYHHSGPYGGTFVTFTVAGNAKNVPDLWCGAPLDSKLKLAVTYVSQGNRTVKNYRGEPVDNIPSGSSWLQVVPVYDYKNKENSWTLPTLSGLPLPNAKQLRRQTYESYNPLLFPTRPREIHINTSKIIRTPNGYNFYDFSDKSPYIPNTVLLRKCQEFAYIWTIGTKTLTSQRNSTESSVMLALETDFDYRALGNQVNISVQMQPLHALAPFRQH